MLGQQMKSCASPAGAVGMVLLGVFALLACGGPHEGVAEPPAAGVPYRQSEPMAKAVTRVADFGSSHPSLEARHLANWIADSDDHRRTDFIMVDKKFATLYVFDAQVRLRESSPVLLGAALGDDTVPGIGSKPIADVRPEERTTPAGRFLAERGHNARGEDVVWVDYDAAVSMHRVLRTDPRERRLERLASKSLADKRISWGCINVPVAFYETTVRPLFATHRALVYVLPDTKSVQEVFGSYDVEARMDVAAIESIHF